VKPKALIIHIETPKIELLIEECIEIQAQPETVFAIYADVCNWHQWDPNTKAASLDGSFQVGTRGRLRPTQGREMPMLITNIVPACSFTVVSKIPLVTIQFDHELQPTPQGVTATHRVRTTGGLAFVIDWILEKRVRQGLTITMLSLKKFVESKS